MAESEEQQGPKQVPEKKKKKLTKQQKQYIFYVIMILVVSGLTIYFVTKDNFFDVIDTMKHAHIWAILIMVTLILAAFIIEGFVLTIFARFYNKKYKPHQGIFNGLIGTFFSAITPFSSGGQFVQAYTFSKQGVKVANSASILVMHFIVFQTSIVLYGAVAFIFGYDSVIKQMGNISIWGLSFSPILLSSVGFIINIFTIVSLFFLAYFKPLHRFILNTGVSLLAKIRIIKNPDKKRRDLTVQVATFRVELKRLMSNFPILILVIVLILAKMTLANSLPYFAGLAMGENLDGQYFNCLWSTSYLNMITCFIPIPGASGGAELAFQLLFGHIFSNQASLSAANLLWRGISYYLGMLLGAVIFFSYHESPKKYVIRADTRTFIDLELVGLANATSPDETIELNARQTRNYAKIEEEKKRTIDLLDTDAVEKSFESINELIQSQKADEAANDVDKMTFERTRKYLKKVAEETDAQEKKEAEASHNEEVLKEIEHDSKLLEEKRLKRSKKKHKKED